MGLQLGGTSAAISQGRDFYLELAKGNIPGHTGVIIRGHNTDLDIGVEEDVWEAGSFLSYLSSAEQMNITSTSIQDDADLVGTGAHTVLVSGLNGNYAQVSEMVTLNGTANVLTTQAFLRVLTILVLTAGSGLTNAGNLTATAAIAGSVQNEADANESLSQSAHYTVASGKTFYSLNVEFNAAKLSGGQLPVIEFRGLGRTFPGGPWIQLFDKKMDTGVVDQIQIEPSVYGVLPATGDLRVVATSDQNNTECRIRLYGVLVDN